MIDCSAVATSSRANPFPADWRARAAWIGAALFSFHPLLVRQAAAASDLALVTTLMVIFAYSIVSIRSVRGAAIAGAW